MPVSAARALRSCSSAASTAGADEAGADDGGATVAGVATGNATTADGGGGWGVEQPLGATPATTSTQATH